MKMDNLNKWLTLTANFGVIASIIFLGLEVSQNTESLQAQSSYNHYLAKTSSMRVIAENPNGLAGLLVKHRQGAELTPTEQIRLILNSQAILGDFEWQYKEISEGRLEVNYNYANEVSTTFSNVPFMKESFQTQKSNNTIDPDFASFVESEVLPLIN